MGLDLKTLDVEKPVLNLDQRHFERTQRGIRVIGTWWHAGDNGPTPCLVLTNAAKKIDPEEGGYAIVHLAQGYQFTEGADERAARFCAQFCYDAANALGFNASNRMTLMNIVFVVRDHLQDLAYIPPRPPGGPTVVADAVGTTPDGREVHREILGYV